MRKGQKGDHACYCLICSGCLLSVMMERVAVAMKGCWGQKRMGSCRQQNVGGAAVMGRVEVIGGCWLQWECDKRGRTVHREGEQRYNVEKVMGTLSCRKDERGIAVNKRFDWDIYLQERWKRDWRRQEVALGQCCAGKMEGGTRVNKKFDQNSVVQGRQKGGQQ